MNPLFLLAVIPLNKGMTAQEKSTVQTGGVKNPKKMPPEGGVIIPMK